MRGFEGGKTLSVFPSMEYWTLSALGLWSCRMGVIRLVLGGWAMRRAPEQEQGGSASRMMFTYSCRVLFVVEGVLSLNSTTSHSHSRP